MNIEKRLHCDLGPLLLRMGKTLGSLPLLHRLAANGDCRAISRLGQGGVDLNKASPRTRGSTALHYAAAFDQPQAVSLLVRLGAQVDAMGEGDLTPLSLAVRCGAQNAANALIDSNARVQDDYSLVEAALSNCSPSLAIKLCEANALANYSSERKNRLLVLACHQNHTNFVSTLLLKGADPETEDPDSGKSLLSLQNPAKCSSEVLRILFQWLLNHSSPLTPEQLKGMSQVQMRHMMQLRRSRSF